MSSEADDAGDIFTRTRTRKRTRAVLDSARESDTRVVTFEDIPRDIKNEILGEAKLPDPVDRALVRAVSRSMRDAVDATGRDIEKLNTSTECRDAAKLGWLSTLKNRLRRGILHKPSVCTSAAEFGHLEIVKWARENGCPWDWHTRAWADIHVDVPEWVHAVAPSLRATRTTNGTTRLLRRCIRRTIGPTTSSRKKSLLPDDDGERLNRLVSLRVRLTMRTVFAPFLHT